MTPQIDISPAIRVRDLVKRYPGRPPVEAVRGLSLEVMRGECFGLLGPNGAGKTTTVEILEGLLAPSSGDVEVLGLTWENNKQQLRQQIGASLQETRLSDKLTVGETIRLFRSFYAAGLDPEAALEMVGLSAKAKVRVGNVSGGERQRLAVATAIVGWPQLVFWTSQPLVWIRSRGDRFGILSRPAAPVVIRCFSPPIQWTRRSVSATVWRLSIRAASSRRERPVSWSRDSVAQISTMFLCASPVDG